LYHKNLGTKSQDHAIICLLTHSDEFSTPGTQIHFPLSQLHRKEREQGSQTRKREEKIVINWRGKPEGFCGERAGAKSVCASGGVVTSKKNVSLSS